MKCKQPNIDLEYAWKCSECNNIVGWSMRQTNGGGTPVCNNCDSDMELILDEEYEDSEGLFFENEQC